MEEKTNSAKISAKEARRLYDRMYYQRNKERIQKQKRQYWERIADRMNAEAAALAESEVPQQ